MANLEDFGVGVKMEDFDPKSDLEKAFNAKKIHVRIQQRGGRKRITSIQGLDDSLDLKTIAKAMKKAFSCNASVEDDVEYGLVVQLQGDQRENVKEWLVAQEIVPKRMASDRIVLHG